MRFIHIADSHLDGFKEAKLSKLGFDNFVYIIDESIKQNIDFLVIAGDLFNSALPRIEVLKKTVSQLKRLAEKNIPVYFIPGSHDFSPQGKSMLDVIELAGLGTNVMKGEVDKNKKLHLTPVVDKKTSAQLCGILGKKGMLDRQYYTNLAPIKIDKNKPSIFLFHTSITELKPKELEKMESYDVTLLPSGFDYYAGGHVHITEEITHPSNEKAYITYPGPTFPNSFSELEKLKSGFYILYDDSTKENIPWKRQTIPSKEIVSFKINANNLSSQKLEEKLFELIENSNFHNKIVLLRIFGTLIDGKTSDLDFKVLFREFFEAGAFVVLKNTHKLNSLAFVESENINSLSANEIQEQTINESIGQINLPKNLDEKEIITQLIKQLDAEPIDGEKKQTFNERMIDEAKIILEKGIK